MSDSEETVKNNEERVKSSEETVSINETPSETITKKDPRKIEAGKRLAAISKAAKERKMREKIEAEMREKNENSILNYLSISPIGLGVPLILGSYFLYKWFSKPKDDLKKTETSNEVEEKKTIEMPPPPKKKFESHFETHFERSIEYLSKC